MSKSITINWNELKLAGSIHYPKQFHLNSKYPLIIICHGFIGSRIGVDRLFVKASDQLVNENCIIIRFDYSGCGESEGEYGLTGLDDLIEQTKTVIDFGLGIEQVDMNKVYLLGHSLGGATALLTAARDKRVHHLILWSSVARPYFDITNIVGKESIVKLETNKEIDYLGYSLTSRFFNSLKGYDPLKELKEFSGNVLLIHGTADKDIPVGYCEMYKDLLIRREYGKTECKKIKNANHTFSCSNHFNDLMITTRNWLNLQLNYGMSVSI